MGIEAHLNKRVMIVDDLTNTREDLAKILRSLGFTNITEMPNGRAALDEIMSKLETPYEIIFSDINMPQLNGISLLKALRLLAPYKKSPIFMVSTVNEKDTILNAVLNGATDYIIKPYSPEIVVEKIISRLK